MIILAATVVIAMSNNGIIERANHAVKITDEKQVQDLAALAWAEAYLDEDRTETLEKVVTDKLAEQGVTTTDWNIEVSNTGVKVTSKDSKPLISFTIAGTTCQAEEGMTWEQWVNSKYNTVSATITSDKVYVGGSYVVIIINGVEVDVTTSTITSGTTYETNNSGSSGSIEHVGGSN